MATQSNADKASKAANVPQPALRIISRRESFWRAGHQFSLQARTLLLSELSHDQVRRLKAEPQLIVVETEATPADLAGERAPMAAETTT